MPAPIPPFAPLESPEFDFDEEIEVVNPLVADEAGSVIVAEVDKATVEEVDDPVALDFVDVVF